MRSFFYAPADPAGGAFPSPPVSRFHLAVFDLDNTLVDTLEAIARSLNAAMAAHLGRERSLAEWVAQFGPTEEGLLRQISPPGRAQEVIRRFQEAYDAEMAGLEPYPGVAATLGRLRAAGVSLGLSTGKGRFTTDSTLRHIRLNEYFDFVLTGDDVTRNKPDPEPLLRMIAETGCAPAETLMVGDALADVRCARAAGAFAALVLWGRKDTRPEEKDALARREAHALFSSVGEFDAWLSERIPAPPA